MSEQTDELEPGGDQLEPTDPAGGEPAADEPDDDDQAADEAPESAAGDEPAGDEPAGDEPDADQPAPPPPPPTSQRDAEKAIKSAEGEAKRHADRLAVIFGDDFGDFVPCPLCLPWTPGFVYPPDVATPPEQVVARVRAFIGEPDLPDLQPASNARICDGCQGLGRRLSGSRVPQFAVLECASCRGRGFIKVGGPEPVPGASEPAIAAVDEPTLPGESEPDTDPWGRHPGDEDYGVMPIYAEQRRQARLAGAGIA